MNKSSIPFILVTGFLGSGKTTLLKRLLKENSSSRKIALIQNEFAPSNVDGEELMRSTGDSFELLEVNNGSVFCVCLLGSFVKSLAEFLDVHHPELVIMEASGLSDPAGIAELFQSEALRTRVYFSEAWCVVDAAHFEKIERMNVRYRHQVQVADRVIVNKTDRVTTDVTENVEKRVRQLNPFCRVLRAAYCDVFGSEPLLLGDDQRRDLEERILQKVSEGRPGLQSGVIKMGVQIEFTAIEKFMLENAGSLIRAKGFFRDPGQNGYAVNYVHGDIHFEGIGQYKGNLHLILVGNDLDLGRLQKELLKLAN